ncbi:uncharacterized protein [Dermacentor andersoni]|uniref:uncharacterized protein n=1 Tax=Dermacentor andersoni TaxID=34620 RepID=UPI003B39FF37
MAVLVAWCLAACLAYQVDSSSGSLVSFYLPHVPTKWKGARASHFSTWSPPVILRPGALSFALRIQWPALIAAWCFACRTSELAASCSRGLVVARSSSGLLPCCPTCASRGHLLQRPVLVSWCVSACPAEQVEGSSGVPVSCGLTMDHVDSSSGGLISWCLPGRSGG